MRRKVTAAKRLPAGRYNSPPWRARHTVYKVESRRMPDEL
jgi:hypothetical protein